MSGCRRSSSPGWHSGGRRPVFWFAMALLVVGLGYLKSTGALTDIADMVCTACHSRRSRPFERSSCRSRYTATETPPQDKVLALKPKPLAWTSRVWRESPGRTIPLFKIDVRIEPREIEDKALAQALRPFAAQLDKIAIYLLHPGGDAAAGAVGGRPFRRRPQGGLHVLPRLPRCAQRVGLMLSLMQTAGASTDLFLSVVPFRVEAEEDRLRRHRLRLRHPQPHRLSLRPPSERHCPRALAFPYVCHPILRSARHMPELLLELFSEEIPARLQARAAEDLRRLMVEGLKARGLEVGEAKSFATPRRLALVIEDVPKKSPAVSEERKGPRTARPSRRCRASSRGGPEVHQGRRDRQGREEGRLLRRAHRQAGAAGARDHRRGAARGDVGFPWPKTMRFNRPLDGEGGAELRWIRPLHSIVLCSTARWCRSRSPASRLAR